MLYWVGITRCELVLYDRVLVWCVLVGTVFFVIVI